MKATAFYRRWNALAADSWRAAGLERIPGHGSRWTRPIGDNKLLIAHTAVNPKYPWSVFAGGNFSFYVYLPPDAPADPGKYGDNFADQLIVFRSLDPPQRDALAATNERVFEKLSGLDKKSLYQQMADTLDCSPDQARQSGLYQTALEVFETEIKTPADALVNPPLYYYDEDDLALWVEWFDAALPTMLDRAINSPDYLIGSPPDA